MFGLPDVNSREQQRFLTPVPNQQRLHPQEIRLPAVFRTLTSPRTPPALRICCSVWRNTRIRICRKPGVFQRAEVWCPLFWCPVEIFRRFLPVGLPSSILCGWEKRMILKRRPTRRKRRFRGCRWGSCSIRDVGRFLEEKIYLESIKCSTLVVYS